MGVIPFLPSRIMTVKLKAIRHCRKFLSQLVSPKPYKAGAVVFPLMDEKLRHREVYPDCIEVAATQWGA